MKTVLDISIPDVTPSLNTLATRHWATKHRMREEWYMRIRAAMPLDMPKATEGERRRVTIIRHSTGMLDADNFSGGCKMVLDCLRPTRKKGKNTWYGIGAIWDDDADHVSVNYEQRRVHRRKDHKTEIIVEVYDVEP